MYGYIRVQANKQLPANLISLKVNRALPELEQYNSIPLLDAGYMYVEYWKWNMKKWINVEHCIGILIIIK